MTATVDLFIFDQFVPYAEMPKDFYNPCWLIANFADTAGTHERVVPEKADFIAAMFDEHPEQWDITSFKPVIRAESRYNSKSERELYNFSPPNPPDECYLVDSNDILTEAMNHPHLHGNHACSLKEFIATTEMILGSGHERRPCQRESFPPVMAFLKALSETAIVMPTIGGGVSSCLRDVFPRIFFWSTGIIPL